MISHFLLRPRSLAAMAVVASAFVPGPVYRVERNAPLDIELVKSAQCEYRGIIASFEKLTQAYALKVYVEPELLGWEARPSRGNPDSEALVTCRYAVGGVVPGLAADPTTADLRARSGSRLDVTWKLNTLAAIQITADRDPYARDALAVFRQTVDELLDRMVLVTESGALRENPMEDSQVLADVAGGTLLLEAERRQGWSYVRVPSETTAGWIQSERVQRVYQ